MNQFRIVRKEEMGVMDGYWVDNEVSVMKNPEPKVNHSCLNLVYTAFIVFPVFSDFLHLTYAQKTQLSNYGQCKLSKNSMHKFLRKYFTPDYKV